MSTPAPHDPAPAPAAACRNCGTPLLGDHCYACGQPVKGLVRPLGNLFGDVMDSVFDLDVRMFRTIGPLFAKPGFLSREYFAGRQVRYVTPFRLFFFLAVVSFFIAQLSLDGPTVNLDSDNAIKSATTVAEVEKLRDAQLAELEKGTREMAGTPAAVGIPGMEAAKQAVREAADKRIQTLQRRAGAPTSTARGNDEGEDANSLGIRFNDQQWDAKKNPLDTWMPAFVDRWINAQIERGSRNANRLKQDPGAFKDAVLGAVPTTLFVLVPIFALMLKLAYLFKRRLYMEHLVIALHSHAFLCLDLLLVLLVLALQGAVGPGVLHGLLGWIEAALLVWMPVYLLLMQKRVYGQGWPMTLLKYFVLGTCYTVLLSFAIVASMAIGLVAM